MLGDKYSGKRRSKFPLQDTDKEMKMLEKFSVQKNWSTTSKLKLSDCHDIIYEMIENETIKNKCASKLHDIYMFLNFFFFFLKSKIYFNKHTYHIFIL